MFSRCEGFSRLQFNASRSPTEAAALSEVLWAFTSARVALDGWTILTYLLTLRVRCGLMATCAEAQGRPSRSICLRAITRLWASFTARDHMFVCSIDFSILERLELGGDRRSSAQRHTG